MSLDKDISVPPPHTVPSTILTPSPQLPSWFQSLIHCTAFTQHLFQPNLISGGRWKAAAQHIQASLVGLPKKFVENNQTLKLKALVLVRFCSSGSQLASLFVNSKATKETEKVSVKSKHSADILSSWPMVKDNQYMSFFFPFNFFLF